MLNQITEAINQMGFEMNQTIFLNLIETIVVIVCFFLINGLISRVLDRRITDMGTRFKWRRGASYALFGVVALLVGLIWLEGLGAAAAVLGLLSAGLAVALNQPLANLAGWVFIVSRKPFHIGDRVEVEGVKGDVIDIRPFTFVLLELANWVDADQSTGRVVYMPNQKVFNQPIFNYTSGIRYIWHEVKVFITYESNWRKAKAILSEITAALDDSFVPRAEIGLQQASREFPIQYSTLESIVYTKGVDRGVQLTARFICDPRRRRGTEEALWERLLDAFSEQDDIHIAYPTFRVYNPEGGTSSDAVYSPLMEQPTS